MVLAPVRKDVATISHKRRQPVDNHRAAILAKEDPPILPWTICPIFFGADLGYPETVHHLWRCPVPPAGRGWVFVSE